MPKYNEEKKLIIRVSSGTAKNKRLKAPKVEGFRSVQEIAKQAVFSILGNKVEGAKVLDLYSGSGNMGIEAISRGAVSCTFVDESIEAVKAINENLQNCGFTDSATVVKSDSVKFVANTEEKYDMIFVDPFYNDTTHVFLLKNLGEVLNIGGTVVFFHGSDLDIVPMLSGSDLTVKDRRRFGASNIAILEAK